VNLLQNDFPPGPRLIQMRKYINGMKGTTVLFILYCMRHYDNWEYPPFIYLALHGTYGMLWVLKDRILPDPKWNAKVTIPSSLIGITTLAFYWMAGWLLISNRTKVTPAQAAIAIAVHTIGCVLMIASDTQKYFTLKLKKGLITDGWFSRSRNTNYLGEVMVYGSYCFLAKHPAPWMFCGFMWSVLFMTNMVLKDASLQRKEGWKGYSEKSNLFFPKLIL